MSNYPAGVSDNHPYFNPQEGSVHVTCGNDEAKVIPAAAVTTQMKDLAEFVKRLTPNGAGFWQDTLQAISARIASSVEDLQAVEREADYECPFEGVMDVAISEEAEWTCPVCGATRTSDTLPEEQDPDRGWDDRYDD